MRIRLDEVTSATLRGAPLAIERPSVLRIDSFQPDIDCARAAEPEAPHDVVFAAVVVPDELGRAGFAHAARVLEQVAFEAAATDQADHRLVGQHEHARSGAAVRRAFDMRDTRQHARLSARGELRIGGEDVPKFFQRGLSIRLSVHSPGGKLHSEAAGYPQ